jgi:UDP-N-acetylglucosamine acyltransferase
MGGFASAHQFVKIGAHVMAGVASVILQDVPPYVMVAGQPCAPHGINSEGLRRRGFTPEAIAAIKRAYRTLYRSGLGLAEARAELEALARDAPVVRALVDFLQGAERGILRCGAWRSLPGKPPATCWAPP